MITHTVRSIPTGVGKTTTPRSPAHRSTVHPHGCGENYTPLLALPSPPGPSPRVWGKRPFFDYTAAANRSIPTGVGKTLQIDYNPLTGAVHPHGCGENSGTARCQVHCGGPSPRVWGKLDGKIVAMRKRRSIPTGVGKTNDAGEWMLDVLVHPHGCGENMDSNLQSGSVSGPSPRVWGKRCCHKWG